MIGLDKSDLCVKNVVCMTFLAKQYHLAYKTPKLWPTWSHKMKTVWRPMQMQ